MVEAVTAFKKRDDTTAAHFFGEQLRLTRHCAKAFGRDAHASVRIACRCVLTRRDQDERGAEATQRGREDLLERVLVAEVACARRQWDVQRRAVPALLERAGPLRVE